MKAEIFQNKNYRLYFLSDLVSNFGTGMGLIGINWFIIDITQSSESVGVFMGIQIFTIFLLLPIAGTLADVFSKIKVLLLSNIFRGVLILTLCFLYYNTQAYIWMYLLAVVNGIGWAFYIPSSRGFIREFMSRDLHLIGNALLETSLQISFFISAGLSGIIYKYYGFYAILIIDAATFLISSVLLSYIKITETKEKAQYSSFITETVIGMRYLYSNTIYLYFGILFFVPSVVTIVSNMVLPGYVYKYLEQSSVTYGVADMFYGIGAFISGMLAEKLSSRYNKKKITGLFFIVSTTILGALYFNTYISGLFVCYFIFGFSNTIIKIITNTIAMEKIPEEIFGRVYAIWNSISFFFQIIFMFFLGSYMDRVSVNGGYVILAICMMIAGIILYPILFKLDRYQPKTSAHEGRQNSPPHDH